MPSHSCRADPPRLQLLFPTLSPNCPIPQIGEPPRSFVACRQTAVRLSAGCHHAMDRTANQGISSLACIILIIAAWKRIGGNSLRSSSQLADKESCVSYLIDPHTRANWKKSCNKNVSPLHVFYLFDAPLSHATLLSHLLSVADSCGYMNTCSDPLPFFTFSFSTCPLVS